VLNVAAAGNTGSFSGTGNTMGWPASFSSVLAVTATNSSDVRPCFSSHGPESELAAPGVPIYSTYLGGYGTLSGTSMASSHVAGAAALVIAAGAQDPDNVRQILTDTVLDLGATGPDDLYGFGLVDAAAAVTAVENPPADTPPSVVLTNPQDGVGHYHRHGGCRRRQRRHASRIQGQQFTYRHRYGRGGQLVSDLGYRFGGK